eukprot:UN23271
MYVWDFIDIRDLTEKSQTHVFVDLTTENHNARSSHKMSTTQLSETAPLSEKQMGASETQPLSQTPHKVSQTQSRSQIPNKYLG